MPPWARAATTSPPNCSAPPAIRQYLEDRRLECACRLLLDTDLRVQEIARLVGYRGSGSFSRAFERRLGARPGGYRQSGGRLSPETARGTRPGLPPLLPRYLVGVAELAPDTACGRCGDALTVAASMWVFEDLAPLCDPCAHRRAPELAAWLATASS